MMDSKHLEFEMVLEKPKTKVYSVNSKHDKSSLGLVQWFPNWRQYCFFPNPKCVWSQSCLEDLTIFLKELKEERKKVKK